MISEGDRLAIKELLAVADGTIVHKLTHFLYFSMETDALKAKGDLEQEGFSVDSYLAFDGRWSVIASHRAVPSESNIAALRQKMEAVAEGLGEYDGWEVDLT